MLSFALAGVTLVSLPVAPALATTPKTFECGAGSGLDFVYSVDGDSHVVIKVNPSTGAASTVGTIPAGSDETINALALPGGGGRYAYAFNRADGSIVQFDVSTSSADPHDAPSNSSASSVIAGAINPANGIYYYASGGSTWKLSSSPTTPRSDSGPGMSGRQARPVNRLAASTSTTRDREQNRMKKIASSIAAFAIAGGVLMGFSGTAEAANSVDCTPVAAVAAKPAVTHKEWQWAALVAKPTLHWEYKWTSSASNPSTDLAHIWVKSLDLSKFGWPQITQTVVDSPAVAAVAAFNPVVSYGSPSVSDTGVVTFGAATCGTWKVASKVHLANASGFQTHDGTPITGGATRFRLVFTPDAGLTLPSTLVGDAFKVGNSAVFHVYVAGTPTAPVVVWAGLGSVTATTAPSTAARVTSLPPVRPSARPAPTRRR